VAIATFTSLARKLLLQKPALWSDFLPAPMVSAGANGSDGGPFKASGAVLSGLIPARTPFPYTRPWMTARQSNGT